VAGPSKVRPERIAYARPGGFHSELPAPLADFTHDIEALRANAARRQFTTRSNEASSCGGDQAQIGQRILDFRALEKAQAAVHLYGMRAA